MIQCLKRVNVQFSGPTEKCLRMRCICKGGKCVFWRDYIRLCLQRMYGQLWGSCKYVMHEGIDVVGCWRRLHVVKVIAKAGREARRHRGRRRVCRTKMQATLSSHRHTVRELCREQRHVMDRMPTGVRSEHVVTWWRQAVTSR